MERPSPAPGLDRVKLRAVRRQLQQSDVAGHHEPLAPVPAGTIEDHHGMGISGDLAADLAEVMVHRKRSLTGTLHRVSAMG